MAIHLCSEIPKSPTSPRISFSHDLSQSDITNISGEHHCSRSISTATSADFDFCIHHNLNHDESTTSAEQLFSDGKIIPTQLQDKTLCQKSKKESLPESKPLQSPPLPRHIYRGGSGNCTISSTSISSITKMRSSDATITKKSVHLSSEVVDLEDHKQKPKSFWQFNRSSSLNCGNGYAGSLCPLPLLSRSNSTGSAASTTNSKKSSSSSRDFVKDLRQNQPNKQSQFSSNGYQKPPLKKNVAASHANGVRINPVLNVPPANLFGLGSFFSINKDKNKKK